MKYVRVLAVLVVFAGIAVAAVVAAQTPSRSASALRPLHREVEQLLATHPPFFRPLVPQLAVPGGGTCFVDTCSIKPCVIPVASAGPGYLIAPVPSLSGRCQPGAGRFRVATVIAR